MKETFRRVLFKVSMYPSYLNTHKKVPYPCLFWVVFRQIWVWFTITVSRFLIHMFMSHNHAWYSSHYSSVSLSSPYVMPSLEKDSDTVQDSPKLRVLIKVYPVCESKGKFRKHTQVLKMKKWRKIYFLLRNLRQTTFKNDVIWFHGSFCPQKVWLLFVVSLFFPLCWRFRECYGMQHNSQKRWTFPISNSSLWSITLNAASLCVTVSAANTAYRKSEA